MIAVCFSEPAVTLRRYTIYGVVQDDGGSAITMGTSMAALGVVSFWALLRRDL